MNPVWLAIFIVILNHRASEAAECTDHGKFPNNLSNDCRGYTMCIHILNNFTRIDIVCPEHSIYSHLDNQCTYVTNYQCLPEHNCTQVGDFANTSTKDCASYVSCVEGLENLVTARLVQCPPKTLFNHAERTCVNDTSIFKCVANRACYLQIHCVLFLFLVCLSYLITL